MRAIALTMTMLTLAACSSDPHLMNLGSTGTSGPDEFRIVPTKALSMPTDLNALPAPTPGAGNLTDPTPQADAVAALGGNPAQLSAQGVGASDLGLVAYASRLGRDPAIRQTTAQEDVELRTRRGRRALEVLARTNVYYRAYQPMTLDSWTETERWRPTGVQMPASPPRDQDAALAGETRAVPKYQTSRMAE